MGLINSICNKVICHTPRRNKQSTEMRARTQGAIDTLLKSVCQNCFTVNGYCQCTRVNANKTTGSKNGFKDGVKPSGPAFRRRCKNNKS